MTTPATDVGDGPFEPWPTDVDLHVEWGPPGARLAADRGDVVVIVDVLTFSTSVVLAVTRGGTALSYSGKELDEMGGRGAAAASLRAEIVASDRAATTARFSLSPGSLAAIGPGDRVVFTSLNGATCLAAAAAAPLVVVGALTNRSAVAKAVSERLAAGVAERCTIVACGERWTSVSDGPDSLRPGIEDLLGAGAVASAATGLRLSPEAQMAAACFDAAAPGIAAVLRGCVSGRELIERGFPDDVELAGAVDSSSAVPCWHTGHPARELTALIPEADT